MPTEADFIITDPEVYGTGSGDAGLLFSSSISASVPVAPYILQGLTVPFNDTSGTDVRATLKQVSAIDFEYEGGNIITATVTDRRQQNGYFFLRTNAVELPAIPDEVGGLRRFLRSTFIFEPYLAEDFTNNDFNPLISNANRNRLNTIRRIVDRNASQVVPQNIEPIRALTAPRAPVPDSNYEVRGFINARYNGSVETDDNIPGNDPALGLRTFEASQHEIDAENSTITEIQLSDRTLASVYFEPYISGALVGGALVSQSLATFPQSGSLLFREQGNRFIRIPSAKIYSTDRNLVYTTNELGGVIEISS